MAVEAHHEPHGYWERQGLALLWVALLSGPIAVATNILAGYGLVKWACASGHGSVLTMIALATLIVALGGAFVGWTCYARAYGGDPAGGRVVDRSYFVAVVATGFALLSALLIVMQTYPRFVLSPCE